MVRNKTKKTKGDIMGLGFSSLQWYQTGKSPHKAAMCCCQVTARIRITSESKTWRFMAEDCWYCLKDFNVKQI